MIHGKNSKCGSQCGILWFMERIANVACDVKFRGPWKGLQMWVVT